MLRLLAQPHRQAGQIQHQGCMLKTGLLHVQFPIPRKTDSVTGAPALPAWRHAKQDHCTEGSRHRPSILTFWQEDP